jgi:hypothetical protein
VHATGDAQDTDESSLSIARAGIRACMMIQATPFQRSANNLILLVLPVEYPTARQALADTQETPNRSV